jgi:hypothetical protein
MDAEAPPLTIAGLILTLPAGIAAQQETLALLRSLPHLTLGELQNRWLSVAAEAADPYALHDQLLAIPGITHVEVAFAEVS